MIETVGDLIEALSEFDQETLIRIPRYQQNMDDNGEIVNGGLEWCTIESIYDSDNRIDLEISVVGEQF
tara:strand:+ start:378 stop:581 length:204 start_codon:yes stop_codon:yes gene_type:complete